MNRPSTTITAAGIGGAIASILMGLLGAFFPDIADKLPAGFEASVATVVAFGAGFLVRERVLRKRFNQEQIERLP